ncbi:MAG: recombinase family protein [Rickettsiales bacterium]
MDKIVAYLRVSTSKQDLNSQKLEILEYARRNNLQINNFVEIIASSQKGAKQRRIDNLLEKLLDANTLIVTELSRLGRSTVEVIDFINNLIKQQVRIIVLKQNLDIKHKHDLQSKVLVTVFSLIGELERDLISARTKEALAAKKAQGKILGKPKGTIQKSKFDNDVPKIKELLNYGLSVRKIAKVLGYTNHIALSVYIKKRKENILNYVV